MGEVFIELPDHEHRRDEYVPGYEFYQPRPFVKPTRDAVVFEMARGRAELRATYGPEINYYPCGVWRCEVIEDKGTGLQLKLVERTDLFEGSDKMLAQLALEATAENG